MKYFLGIDGGGSRTRAALLDAQGRLAGRGEAGASNDNNVSAETVIASLRAAAEEAWRQAGAPFAPAAQCFLGMAGVKDEEDARRVAALAASAGLAAAEAIEAANDCESALAGGNGGAPGIVLICGTGSHCFGRNAAGARAWCGGWGWRLDDAGSGYRIGLEAIRAAAFIHDGRLAGSPLERAVLDALGIARAEQINRRLYLGEMQTRDIAALAPLVLDAARAGDPVATGILREQAQAAARLVAVTARRLEFASPPVLLAGGLAESGPPYTPMLADCIGSEVPGCTFIERLLPPVAGAALLAWRRAGGNPDARQLQTLVESWQGKLAKEI